MSGLFLWIDTRCGSGQLRGKVDAQQRLTMAPLGLKAIVGDSKCFYDSSRYSTLVLWTCWRVVHCWLIIISPLTHQPCRILYQHEGPSPSPSPQCEIWTLFCVLLYYFSTLRLLMLTENSAAPCHAWFSLRNSMRKRRTGASEECGSSTGHFSGLSPDSPVSEMNHTAAKLFGCALTDFDWSFYGLYSI